MTRTCLMLRIAPLVCLGVLASARGLKAAEPGQQKALLIAVQEYDDKRLSLSVTLRDSIELRRVLLERAGIPPTNITTMNDESVPELRPRLANLRTELKRFLAEAEPEDRVLIFFSGHGFIADDGRTYLVPADFKFKDPAGTGLPASEIREALDSCKASVKFLILDCCQAGGDKSIDEPTAPPDKIASGLALKNVANCLVLASCQAEEKSYEWPERKQSVFTYWLCQALEGGADKDANGRITFEEVYEYCDNHVPKTVATLFAGKTQSPVKYIGLNVKGVSEILTLQPDSPESLCARFAMLLDLEARERQVKSIGVLEFAEPVGKLDGLNRSNLPAYCSERVRTSLAARAGQTYRVLNEEETRNAGKGLTLADLGDATAMRKMGREGGGIDAIVSGTLRRRNRTMNVECEMIATASGDKITSPSGLMPLTEGLLADQGRSFDNRARKSGDPRSEVVVDQVLSQSAKANPQLDPEFPFAIEVYTVQPGSGGKPAVRRKKAFLPMPADAKLSSQPDANSLIFGATRGEQVEIWLHNRSDRQVGVALLIDGINTLGQKRERVERARLWVVEPRTSVSVSGWYVPRGLEAGDKETMTKKEFIVGDLADSVAGRLKFGDAIGTVTAAFFSNIKDNSRGPLAMGEGKQTTEVLSTRPFARGKLLGAINLKYADEKAIRAAVAPAGR